MERDWADDNKRVSRLVSQMRYLNVDALVSSEAFPLAPLLEEAYQEACKYQPAKAGKVQATVTYDSADQPYASIAAEQDGQERAATDAARQIQLELAAWLANKKPA
jgi:hypothetical protein